MLIVILPKLAISIINHNEYGNNTKPVITIIITIHPVMIVISITTIRIVVVIISAIAIITIVMVVIATVIFLTITLSVKSNYIFPFIIFHCFQLIVGIKD